MDLVLCFPTLPWDKKTKKKKGAKIFPRVGRWGEFFLFRECAAGVFIPFCHFSSASHVDSCAMTQVFVSLWGCCGSGSISMTDLIYPSRIQRGPRLWGKGSFNSSTVSAKKAQITELCSAYGCRGLTCVYLGFLCIRNSGAREMYGAS